MSAAGATAAPRAPLGVGGGLALVLALALLAVVVVNAAWTLFAPAPFHARVAPPEDPAAVLAAAGLFRGGAAPSAAPAAAAAPATLGAGVRLLGVFAEREGRGYALFRLASGPRLVAAGQEIAAGATLVAVRADGVRIRENGSERDVVLRVPPPPPAPRGSVAAKAAGPLRAACAPPAGFKGPMLALNAELMAGLIAQPESWKALVEPAGGALAVRDDSGFAAMLGLKRGDRIATANGIPLTTPDDLVAAVLKPLAANQPVRVTGTRDGQTRELWLVNAGC